MTALALLLSAMRLPLAEDMLFSIAVAMLLAGVILLMVWLLLA